MTMAKLFVPAGAPFHSMGGEVPAPSPVNSSGNAAPSFTTELCRINFPLRLALMMSGGSRWVILGSAVTPRMCR